MNTESGDWTCSCGELNFKRRGQCRNCKVIRSNAISKKTYSGFQSNLQYGIHTINLPMRPGDWMCPNEECCEINFACRKTCRKCDPKNNKHIGSWMCPNDHCNQINMEYNIFCHTCNQPRKNEDQ